MSYKKLENFPPSLWGIKRKYAVLLLIEKKKSDQEDVSSSDIKFNIDLENDYIILERRSSRLRTQPLDICFPGGRIEADEKPEEAAIRETVEELGIEGDKIEIAAPLDYLVTLNRNFIYPYVGIIYNPTYRINEEEVEEIIKIKLKDLLNTEKKEYMVRIKQHPSEDFPYDKIVGGKEYPFQELNNPQYFISVGDKHIWGMTALILINFLNKFNRIIE